MTYLPIIISSVCGLLLISLVGALIFSQSFRNDVLGGEGEATVLGIISVKGVAIVLLCGIFVGGLLYPLQFATNTNNETPTPVSGQKPASNSTTKKTIVIANIYYFPSRECDALRTKIALEEKDFIVNIYKAGPDIKLAEHRPSYIKYIDYNLMLKAKRVVENLLKQDFNIDAAPTGLWPENTVLFILTSHANNP